MDPSHSGTVRPIGHVLVAAAALGKSLGTLLGPTSSTKCVFQEPNSGASMLTSVRKISVIVNNIHTAQTPYLTPYIHDQLHV